MSEPIIRLKNITKFFPGVVALNNMSIDIFAGEVHGVIGENGAGKSTLIKVLTGVHKPDRGEVVIDDQVVRINDPITAIDMGIGCVYQELNIVPDMNVADNVFIGTYLSKGKSPFIDRKAMNEETRKIMASLNSNVDPETKCSTLGVGMQQMVEIAKAVRANSRLLIMDEPTSSLSEGEVKNLMEIIRLLKSRGVAMIFISHKLEEMFEICDKVTVMRDGRHISTNWTQDTNKDRLIHDMVGRDISELYPKIPPQPGDVALEVQGFSSPGKFVDISFKARNGEILGFSGLVGAGRTELVRAIFGADPHTDGQLFLHGEAVNIREPREAINRGLALLTENRKEEGLILDATLVDNINLTTIDKYGDGIFTDQKMRINAAEREVKNMSIKAPSVQTIAGTLSGGNQQKVVIGKWLNTEADIFIFDEPTRGIDVRAKTEVYNLINQLVQNDKCVIMISSELPELIGMADRVLVFRTGRIMADIMRDSVHFNEEDIMKAAWGGKLDG